MKYLFLLFTGILALSCDSSKPATPSGPAKPAAVEPRQAAAAYTCLGNEPFWSVNIKGSDIIFRTPDEGPVTYPYQAPQQRGKQKVFSSKAGNSSITVTIREEPCTDTMSGEAFPYTVEVSRDGKIYHGCGK